MSKLSRSETGRTLAAGFAVLIFLACCACAGDSTAGDSTAGDSTAGDSTASGSAAGGSTARATFAGGCFWCMEPPYDKLDGVISTTSGYAGGSEENPTYRQVSSGRTGHTEVVQVVYDPERVSYAELLEVFWRNIDPTVKDRQFCDRGSQYRTGIFYHDDEQKRLAEESKQKVADSGRFKMVFTEVTALDVFYPAEEYHQDYYKKNPANYKAYRYGCGRDRRLQQLWGEED